MVRLLHIIILTLILTFSGCIKKKDVNETCPIAATIVAYSDLECLCCPGWTAVTEFDDTIRVTQFPNDELILLMMEQEGLPLYIRVDFEDEQLACDDQFKKITCVEVNYTPI